MENAAINACDPQLPEGYNTVGIAMNVKHVAATPIGLTVTAKATLVEQDRKKLTFKIEAHDEAGLVGEATHDRFIIESDRDLRKQITEFLGVNHYTLLHLRQKGGDLDEIYRVYFEQAEKEEAKHVKSGKEHGSRKKA